MNERRGERGRVLSLRCAVTIATVTGGYVLGSAVAGFEVPSEALVVALVASWLCIVVLALRPSAATVVARANGTAGREVDPVTGLLRYDSRHDDAAIGGELRWAALVIEVDTHLAASAFDPTAADVLFAQAGERVSAAAASYGGIARRLHGPQFVLLVAGLEEAALSVLASTLHDSPTQVASQVASVAPAGAPLGQGRLAAGVAVALPGHGDVAALIRSAGSATAQAKRLGTETPVFFHDRLAEEARERLAVGRALRSAIDEREIDLAYQPQVDLTDGSLLGVEVLARWHDPVYGPIAPDRFVSIAAEMGLSGQLDRLIFEKAFAQLAAWDAAGVTVPRICVNITPQTIAEGRPLSLPRMLATYGIRSERVTAEITESRVLDGTLGSEAVQRIRDLGMQVALDDFGSGQSSFSQLVSLPVTGVKIDRSLLSDHDADAAVLGAIIQAGTALGLAVTAVGIETAAQHDLLVRLGCVVGQGYLYSRPLSADELRAQLDAATTVA